MFVQVQTHIAAKKMKVSLLSGILSAFLQPAAIDPNKNTIHPPSHSPSPTAGVCVGVCVCVFVFVCVGGCICVSAVKRDSPPP